METFNSEKELMNSNIFKEKIFKSRISLRFENPEIDRSYQNSFFQSDYYTTANIVNGTIFSILFLVIIINIIRHREVFHNFFMPCIIIPGVMILIMLSLLVMRFWKNIMRVLMEYNILPGIHFLSIGIFFNFYFSYHCVTEYPAMSPQPDMRNFPVTCMLINAFCYFAQALFIELFIRKFVVFLYLLIIHTVLNWVLNYFIMVHWWLYLYISLSHLVVVLSLAVGIYLKDFNSRICFYIKIKKTMNENYTAYENSPIENLKYSYFCIDNTGKICYMNKATKKLITFIERNIKKSSCSTSCDSNTSHIFMPIPDYWETFKANEIKYTRHLEKNVLISHYDSETRTVEYLLNNIEIMNDDLPSGIIKYMKDFKKDKIPKNTEGNTEQVSIFPQLEFSFKEFYDILKSEECRSKDSGTTTTQQSSFLPKVTQINNNNNNNISDVESNIQCNVTSALHQLIMPNSINEGKSKNTFVQKIKQGLNNNNNNNNTQYIFLGKAVVKLSRKIPKNSLDAHLSDLIISYRVNHNNGQIEFILEDNSPNMLMIQDRKETVQACRSLFLSKIAHEFRNPICNILEIVNYISDDLHKENGGNANQMCSVDSDLDSCESESKSLSFPPGSNRGFKSNNNNNNLFSQLTLLKNICEIMLNLIKDFTFYSSVNDDDSDGGDARLAMTHPKEKCTYKKIIEEIVNIFLMKANIDRKDNKLKIRVNFEEEIPDFLECNQEYFTSLMFNLLYHTYKSTQNGLVTINVGYSNDSTCTCTCNRMLLFDISTCGICSTTALVRIYKNEKKLKLKCEGIDELEEEQEQEHTNSLIDDDNSPTDRGVNYNYNNNNNNNKQMSFFATTNSREIADLENFHLKKLFMIHDTYERNKIIEEFNNHFSLYISHIYAKKLSSQLHMESDRIKSKLFFYLDSPPDKKIDCKKIESVGKDKKKESEIYVNNPEIPWPYRHISNTVLVPSSSNNHLRQPELPKTIRSQKPQRSNPRITIDDADKDSTCRTVINDDKIELNYSVINNLLPSFKTQSSLSSEVFRNKKQQNKTLVIHHPGQTCISIKKNLKRTSSARLRNSAIKYHFPRQTLIDSSFNLKTVNINTILEEDDKAVHNKIFSKEIRVLLVDDESFVRKGLNRFLNSLGKEKDMIMDVQNAENGFECLNLIYSYHMDGKSFDAMIIDENMPYFKGSQIIRMLTEIIENGELSDMVIISYTSYDSQEKKEYIYKAGADYVINKPMKYDDFKPFFYGAVCSN